MKTNNHSLKYRLIIALALFTLLSLFILVDKAYSNDLTQHMEIDTTTSSDDISLLNTEEDDDESEEESPDKTEGAFEYNAL